MLPNSAPFVVFSGYFLGQHKGCPYTHGLSSQGDIMEANSAYGQVTAPKGQTAGRPAMDYLFLGGVLALDLVNTEVIVRGKRYDLFASPEDVAVWWRQARTHYPDVEHVRVDSDTVIWNTQLLERIKRLRAAIRTLCTN